MSTSDSFKALVGKRVVLDLTSAADSAIARGKLLGTIDAQTALSSSSNPTKHQGRDAACIHIT